MEEGSLRCDANVSLRPEGSSEFGTKVEIKNMNSVRSMERAIAFEIERQSKALDAGEPIVQETRHWDEDAGATKSMRSKEEAFDYRYFPEPDIPALEPDPAWIEDVRATLPELPAARLARYETQYGLRTDVAKVLVADRDVAGFFEEAVGLGGDASAVATWITQDLAALVNAAKMDFKDAWGSRIEPRDIVSIVAKVADGSLSGQQAKSALESRFNSIQVRDSVSSQGSAVIDRIIEEEGLAQVSDTGELGAIADRVIADNPEVVEKFRGGNEGVIGFLVGQVMKASGGSANPKLAQELLRERLSG
jgi:aspartyl-tRNA(Asn)/glutamyl-tRNA(Gln) amidotransferase subunit B